MKRTSITVPEGLIKQALDRGIVISKVCVEAIERSIELHDEEINEARELLRI